MSTEVVETFPTEQQFDDQALFDDAEAVEAPNPTEAAVEAKEETPEPEPVLKVVEDKPPIPPKPEWRLKEDAERARQAETELANERAEKAALRQRLEAMERANQPKPVAEEKAAKPDPLLDPEAYEAYLERKFEERQIARDRESSLQQAAKTYKEEFQEAYAAAQKAVDPALRAMMHQSRDPGETLIQWHREQKTRQEIGGDLTAYKQRLRDEALKDPEFRKAAMAAWQNEAQPLTNGRPNIAIPPSLNGASRSNTSLSSTVGNDLSDEGLWEHANAT